MVNVVARAFNWGLETDLPAGSRAALWSGGQRAKPPEAEAFSVFGRSMEAVDCPIF